MNHRDNHIHSYNIVLSLQTFVVTKGCDGRERKLRNSGAEEQVGAVKSVGSAEVCAMGSAIATRGVQTLRTSRGKGKRLEIIIVIKHYRHLNMVYVTGIFT